MEMILFTILGVLSRLTPHPANMTAVAGASLFVSAKYGIKKGLIVMLATMLISDSVKGLHSVMWATYGALFLTVCIGVFIGSKRNAGWVIGGTMLSSVLFFIITNFAVWLAPHFMYPRTLTGLIECYTMAIPFFRNTVIGDLFYSGVFFGGFAFVHNIKQQYGIEKVRQFLNIYKG